MSDPIDAAGSLVTATLVASQVEGGGTASKAPQGTTDDATDDASHGASDHAPHACLNCGTALTGAYCHACGQAAHVHRSLLHFGEELLHGLLHFETKAWRTLPLLVWRPGLLTRRYIDGQRVRYVSPLALFLFMVFLMFFSMSWITAGGPNVNGNTAEAQAASRLELARERDDAARAVSQAEAALKRIEPAAGTAATGDEAEALQDAKTELAAARVQLAATEAALRAFDLAAQAAGPAASAAGAASAPNASNASNAASGPTAEGREPRNEWGDLKRELQQNRASIDTGSPAVDRALRHAFDNPELALYKFKKSASSFSFMLVPISLPFLWLVFFWRRGITMYDHAVFALYSLSFMSLLGVVVALLSALSANALAVFLAICAPPVHMARQLRETYGLSAFSTAWRTLWLLTVSAITFMLFMLFVLAVSMG